MLFLCTFTCIASIEGNGLVERKVPLSLSPATIWLSTSDGGIREGGKQSKAYTPPLWDRKSLHWYLQYCMSYRIEWRQWREHREGLRWNKHEHMEEKLHATVSLISLPLIRNRCISVDVCFWFQTMLPNHTWRENLRPRRLRADYVCVRVPSIHNEQGYLIYNWLRLQTSGH